MSTDSLTNRHIAKLLDNLERLTDMPTLAKTAVKQEMWWLSQDIEQQVKQETKQEKDSEEWTDTSNS
jgi:hypothetical protein